MARTPSFRARPHQPHPVQGKVLTSEPSHNAMAHTAKAAAHDAVRAEVRKTFKKHIPHHHRGQMKD